MTPAVQTNRLPTATDFNFSTLLNYLFTMKVGQLRYNMQIFNVHSKIDE